MVAELPGTSLIPSRKYAYQSPVIPTDSASLEGHPPRDTLSLNPSPGLPARPPFPEMQVGGISPGLPIQSGHARVAFLAKPCLHRSGRRSLVNRCAAGPGTNFAKPPTAYGALRAHGPRRGIHNPGGTFPTSRQSNLVSRSSSVIRTVVLGSTVDKHPCGPVHVDRRNWGVRHSTAQTLPCKALRPWSISVPSLSHGDHVATTSHQALLDRISVALFWCGRRTTARYSYSSWQ
jgi:hypothetical protein